MLIAENIIKKYSNHTALDDVSISVSEGCIYGLLGPNGAGKTSLIRIINQITAPDSGNIFIKGEKLSSKHIHQIGYLPEERGLYKKMAVGEQVLYLAQLKGMKRHDALVRLKYWFEKFEIQSWWSKTVEELSKGMQQKVQFIATILHEPKLIILDEPFSGFDPINTNILKKEIIELKDKGATIIFSTHNMTSVEEICDYISLINKSKKIIEGDINSIRNKYARNIYDIEFTGYYNKIELSQTSDYKIIEIDDSENFGKIKLELINNNISNNDLLKRMISIGAIRTFQKHLPSMNDIFINLVENKYKTIANNE